jgi:steroid 5-alpha reductase family enzyme
VNETGLFASWLGSIPASGGWAVAVQGLAAAACIGLATWIASLIRRDVSLVDRVWSVCIVGAGFAYALALPAPGPRTAWVLGLAGLWALRLSLYITVRNWGHGEDRRYQAIRARNEPRFAFKSLYLVFALQAVLAWIVSAPLLAAVASPRAWSGFDTAGVLLAGFGVGFEAIADAQMSRFKGEAANQGKVMDRGLWRLSRHPNYFGEFCVWWGLWLLALGAGGGWSIVSPLLMSVLLLKVSGVTLLEKDMTERRPAYRDYVARTPAFFPGRPKAGAARGRAA